MQFNNEIVLNGNFGPNGLALTNNVDKSIRTGAELYITYRLSPAFTLINNSSYNYSRITEQQLQFSPILTPPIIINQEVIYTFKRYTAAIAARYQDMSFIDFANTSTIDEYFMLNMLMSYKTGKIQLTLFENNLTNAAYFNNGYVDFTGSKRYFVPAPVNLYIAAKYSF